MPPGPRLSYEKWAARTAMIIEEDSDGPPDWMATARFTVHTSDSDRHYRKGGDGLTLDEALEWALPRAGAVIVRCFLAPAYRWFSAGELWPAEDDDDLEVGDESDEYDEWEPDPDPIEPWPEGGLQLEPRRLPRFEFLDRTDADEPIEWVAKVETALFEYPRGFAVAWEAALRVQQNAEVGRIHVPPEESPDLDAQGPRGRIVAWVNDAGLVAEVKVVATTVDAAREQAVRACEDALNVATDQLGTTQERRWSPLAGGPDRAFGEVRGRQTSWYCHPFPADSELAYNASIDHHGLGW